MRNYTDEFSGRPGADLAALVESDDQNGYNEHEPPVVKKTDEEETAPFEEGYGIGEDEPAGTNSYDVTDEWN